MFCFLEKYSSFATKNFLFLNIILVIMNFSALFSLRGLKFDVDWLRLFSANDQLVKDYNSIHGARESERDLYFKVSNTHAKWLIGELSKLGGVEHPSVIKESEGVIWVKASIANGLSNRDNLKVITKLRGVINSSKVEIKLTGPLVVLDEFNENIRSDFNITGIVSFTFIAFLLILVYGFNFIVIYSFIVQLLSMIIALSIYHLFFDSINMIAATIPCIILGLGVDFVIHLLSGSMENPPEGSQLSFHLYKRSAVPLFWGAVTTGVSFLSLYFARLKGLETTGVLGFIFVIVVYFFTMAYIPPASAYFKRRKPILYPKIKIPCYEVTILKYKNYFLGFVIILTTVVSIFVTKVKMESRVEKLYNPQMSSLLVQRELRENLGVYPVPIFIYLKSDEPQALLKKLLSIDGLMVYSSIIEGEQFVAKLKRGSWITVFSHKDPFDVSTLSELKSRVTDSVNGLSVKPKFTGVPFLANSLNQLLLEGMRLAVIAIGFAIFFITLFLFKDIFVSIAVLSVLFLATYITYGLFGVCGIRLSAYTIILFHSFWG